ncbi:MAG: hypothetical protein Q9172_005689 [Xanthocarpia lactea]
MPVQDLSTTTAVQSDLWSKALETLDDEVKDSLDLTKATYCDVTRRALEEAQKRKILCIQKCWKVKNHKGETIILRDVVEKIIVWVQKFIAVGDMAMQYDPVHAAPACQMSINDNQVFVESVQNLETISYLIARYGILEQLYLQRNSAARDKLQEIMILLYAEILTFLAKASNYFRKSKRERVVGSIFKFSADDQMAKISSLDSQISKLTDIFSIDLQIDLTSKHNEVTNRITAMISLLASFDEPIKRLVADSTLTTQRLREKEQIRLLRWLSLVPCSAHHRSHSEKRIPGSGQWLLKHDEYLRWRNMSSSTIFLLCGIIGCGKTTIASIVVDAFLQEASAQTSSMPFAYFYCSKNAGEAERCDPHEIMRSVLRQLTTSHSASSTIHERVIKEYERQKAAARVYGFEVPKLQVATCTRLILETTAYNPATIVVDAVDEIPLDSRHALLLALGDIVRQSASVVKVFVTSRDDSNVRALLADAISVRIEDEHTQLDMERFVQREVASAIQNCRILNGDVSDTLREELIQTMRSGAGEMFIWVLRQIESLSQCSSEVDIRTAMRQMPESTLDKLYEESFSRISKSGRNAQDCATKIFGLLLCTREPLSPAAVIQAIGSRSPHRGERMTLDRITRICCDLVVQDMELKILRFVHVSFQEFLHSKMEFAPRKTHRAAAIECLDFCLQGSPQGMERSFSPKEDFHHYSAIYWAEHCRLTGSSGEDNLVASRLLEFFFDEDEVSLCFLDWCESVKKFAQGLPRDHPLAKPLNAIAHSASSPLFTACAFGLSTVVDSLAHQKHFDWDLKNELGQSALYLAAEAGHKEVVERLLQQSVDLDILGGKLSHPLHAACSRGHIRVVELLLASGANPKLGPKNALEHAILAGHEEVALLLLHDKFDLSDKEEHDRILQQAAGAGFTEVVQHLQKEYASVYGTLGSSNFKALEAALFKGRTKLIQRHIERSSNPSDAMPKDCIAVAALGGHDALITFLVGNGFDLNQDSRYGTALRAACLMGHESTVRHLLNLGVALESSSSLGDPLQAAAVRGHSTIAKILLSNGVNVNSQTGLYGTALQAAAYRGHHRVVEILIDAGADVHQEGFACDAFHAASEGGHEDIVRLFLKKGFKVRVPLMAVQARRAATPVSKRRHMHNLLREASPDTTKEAIVDQEGDYEFNNRCVQAYKDDFADWLRAIRRYWNPKQRLSQSDRKDQNYICLEGSSALRGAAARGHGRVVGLLLSQSVPLGITRFEIVSAFKQACVFGHAEVVGRFLSVQLEAKELRAAVEAAASRGHLAVSKLLTDHEVSLGIFHTDTTGPSRFDGGASNSSNSFNQAAQKSNPRFVPFFLEHHPDPRTCVVEPEAVVNAAGNGHMDVLPVFIERMKPTSMSQRTINRSLQAAASGGHKCVVKYLSAIGAEVDSIEEEIRSASDSKDPFPLIISFKKGIGPRRVTALQAALIGFQRFEPDGGFYLGLGWEGADRSSQEETIEVLIAKGANVGLTADNELHPLRLAASYCSPVVIETLLLSGANTTDSLRPYDDALRAAASRERDSATIVSILLKFCSPSCTLSQARTTGLNQALSLFEVEGQHSNDGRSSISSSIEEVLHSGPGATVKNLLKSLSEQRADGPRYWLLLQMACMAGDGEYVELLIQRGINVNGSGNYYGTALQAASRVGNTEIIERLLDAGAELNILQGAHGTALRAAVLGGHEEIVRILVDHGADVNLCYEVGHKTILHLALESANYTIFRTLLTAGADINVMKPDQQHIMIATCQHGDATLVKLLLDRGVDCNVLGVMPKDVLAMPAETATPLNAACARGNLSVVRLLLDHGADVENANESSDTPLLAAIRANHLSIVQALLDAGADVDHTVDETPLSQAAFEGKLEVMEELLEKGANIGGAQVRFNALAHACKGRQAAAVQLLLEDLSGTPAAADICSDALKELSEKVGGARCRQKAHVTRRSHFKFQEHTRHEFNAPTHGYGRQLAAIELLLENLSGIPAAADICSDALPAAMRAGQAKILRLLLGHNLPPSLQILRLACITGDLEAVKLLLDTGINVNGDDGTDEPLLHIAAYHSQPAIVQFLIDCGADVNLQSPNYGSPITSALEGCTASFFPAPSHFLPRKSIDERILQCEQITRSLLDAGSDVDIATRFNPLYLASYLGSESIVRQVLEHLPPSSDMSDEDF